MKQCGRSAAGRRGPAWPAQILAAAMCLTLLCHAGNAAASLQHDRALQQALASGIAGHVRPRSEENAAAADFPQALAWEEDLPIQASSVPAWGRPAFSLARSAFMENALRRRNAAEPAAADGEAASAFRQAAENYPDLRAWFSWPGVLETAVAWHGDNEYYLGHTLDGAESRAGTPFFDFRSAADPAEPAALVYGHNMKSGEAFGMLGHYQSREAALAAPPLTAVFASGSYEYLLFAAFTEDVGVEGFWNYPETAAAGRDEFLRLARQRALYWLETPPQGAPVLGLSTCIYTGVNSRLVLLLYQTGRTA